MEPSFHDVIRKALPTLQETEFQKVFDHLDAIGVRTDTDLRFVSVEDVIDVIPLIAARRLVHYLKNSGESCASLHDECGVTIMIVFLFIQLSKGRLNLVACILSNTRPQYLAGLAIVKGAQ